MARWRRLINGGVKRRRGALFGVPIAFLAMLAFSVAYAGGRMAVPGRRPQRRVVPTEREWEVQEWEVQRFLPRGSSLQAIGFGSGGSITTLVNKSPRAIFQFDYFSPQVVTGGLMRWWKPYPPGVLPLDAPTDVVGVTWDGVPLYLDSSTATVKASTISGRRALIVSLAAGPVVQSACAVNARTIVFVESTHPDTIFVRSVGNPLTHAVSLLPKFQDAEPATWSTVSLDGSMGTGCALWAPRWRDVITVTQSAVHPEWRLRWSSDPVTTPERIIAWFTRRAVAPIMARDVTVFPGGVAVLSADGKAIDLYSIDNGTYLATMLLPRPALRIAGAGPRVFVLSQARDSILLASYVLPQNARALAPRNVLGSGSPPPAPKWLRALRQNSW